MAFEPGDAVHVALFGRGVVREVRNGGRYLVDIKGNAMVVAASRLTAADSPARRATAAPERRDDAASPARHAAQTLDLHGRTIAEAEAELDVFLNDALMAGHAEVRVIHGISGGRVRAAVHARLRRVSAVRGFRIDPSNAGATIVTF